MMETSEPRWHYTQLQTYLKMKNERDDAVFRAERMRAACGPLITMLDIIDNRARVYGLGPDDHDIALKYNTGSETLMLTWGELRALRAAALKEGE